MKVKNIYLGQLAKYNVETKELILLDKVIAYKIIHKKVDVFDYYSFPLSKDIITKKIYSYANSAGRIDERDRRFVSLAYVVGKNVPLSLRVNKENITLKELMNIVNAFNEPQEKIPSLATDIEPIQNNFLKLLTKTRDKIKAADMTYDEKNRLLQELINMAENYYHEMMAEFDNEDVTLSVQNTEYKYIDALADFELKVFNPIMERKKILTRDLAIFKKVLNIKEK